MSKITSQIVIAAFVVLALALNIVVAVLHEWLERTIDDELLYPGLIGIVTGEFCVVVLLSSLITTNWQKGLLGGIALMVAWYCTLLIGFKIVNEHIFSNWPRVLASACVFPWFLLVASTPLIGLRHSGWQLVHTTDARLPAKPFRIADLFHATAMLAATLTLLRVPSVVSEMDASDYWGPILIVSGVFFAVGLLAMPPATWLAFRPSSHVKSILGLGILASLVYSAIILICQFFYDRNASWDSRSQVLQPVAATVGGTLSILYTFMLLFRWTGVILIRERPRFSSTQSPGEPTTATTASPAGWLSRGRWQTALAIAVAAAVSFGLAWLQSWRQATDQEIARLAQVAGRCGGQLSANDRQITWLKLGDPATDDDLEHFRDCKSIMHLNLDSRNITNKSLDRISKFQSLQTLTLQNSALTDDGLPLLTSLQRLHTLDVSGTSVTAAGLRQLAGNIPINNVMLNRCKVSDADCAILARIPNLVSVSLSETAVTNVGVQELGRKGNLHTVTLNNTAVDGSGLEACPRLYGLHLNGTRLNDNTIHFFARNRTLGELSIAKTEITDQGIQQLTELKVLHTLDAQHTRVSDSGIGQLVAALPNLRTLNLSGTAVTGTCFQFGTLSSIRELNLSDTRVTDATLPHIAKLRVTRLILSGTQITAAGVLNARFTNLHELVVGPQQFTGNELQQLRTALMHVTVENDGSDQ